MKLYPQTVTASTDAAYGLFFQHFRALDDNGKKLNKKTDIAWSFDAGTTGLSMDGTGKLHKHFPLVINGVELLAGKATITATVGSDTASAVINITEGNAPVVPATLKSVSISPATSSATVGTAYTQKFTTTCQEGDDGSYSYSWSASGSTSGMSLDNATIAAPTLSGTPTTSGSITLTVLVTDSYGNKATSSSTVSVAAAAPVIESCSISPTTSTATVGTAYSQVFTLTGSPSDAVDHYQWNKLSGAATDGLTLSTSAGTAAISGTPTTAGSFTLSGFAYDSQGHYKSATATITVSAAGNPAGTLIPANCSNNVPTTLDVTVGQAFTQQVDLTLDGADDGTYQYSWFLNGNGGGFGTIYSDAALTKAVTQQSFQAGLQTVYFSTVSPSGTVGSLSSPHWGVNVKDSAGNIYKYPSNWTSGNGTTNAAAITMK
ncbi:putative Ig domain-containing protein [uncultured Citrobacter sp.]|uniref:putative Ig domain-containing protein n=1 Tax=uncultured Citrobacter sp. TaxID=200446 RepID=UPI00266D15BF|nr:putative Ig domain-containing protein [uncultured Citrobacter sp.]